MSFVHPAFLWFLSLLAIPIIIHLFHFRRFKRFYFPSLKYLKEQEQEKKSVKRLKRWLILCARILAFTCLIFAFAQPYFQQDAVVKNGIRVTALYIDNSFSMSAKGTEGELLSEAREIAKGIVLKSPGSTRFLITTNAFSGLERKMHSKATALQQLDEIDYHRAPRRMDEVLNWQDEYLMRYDREQEHIGKISRVLISDFQKSTCRVQGYNPKQLNIQSKNYLVQCKAQHSDNLYVDSIWMESPVHKPNQQCHLFIRIKNGSSKAISDATVDVKFDNKTRMTNVSIPAHSSTLTDMYFTPTHTGYIEGKVSVSDRYITWDDDFYFVNRIANQGKAVIINGENAPNNPERVFATESFYNISAFSEFSFNQRDLNQADIVILNGLNSIPSGITDDIIGFMKQGGSVFLIPGDEINNDGYEDLFNSVGLEGFKGKNEQGNQLSEISYQSTFFKGMFEKQQKSLNLPLIKKVYSLRNFKQANAEILLRLRNQLPLLLRLKNNGNFFLLTSPIQSANGSLVDNALFPSILLRSAELSLRALPLYQTIGTASIIDLPAEGNEEQALSMQSNELTFIPRQLYMGGFIRIQLNQAELSERLKEGYYTFKSDRPIAKIGVNLNRTESNMAVLSADELISEFNSARIENIQVEEMTHGSSTFQLTMDRPSSFWRIFVVFALSFLLIEMAILKFWK